MTDKIVLPLMNPAAAELANALTTALRDWVGKKYGDGSLKEGIKISGPELDVILNALIIFSASQISVIHSDMTGQMTKENNIAELNEHMIMEYTDHFNQILKKCIIGDKDEQPS